jgi:hypothetical protein
VLDDTLMIHCVVAVHSQTSTVVLDAMWSVPLFDKLIAVYGRRQSLRKCAQDSPSSETKRNESLDNLQHIS